MSQVDPGVGLFLAKKLVNGDIPRVDAFLSCLTPLLSIDFFAVAFLASLPKVLLLLLSKLPSPPLPFRRIRKVDSPEIELSDEVVDSEGVDEIPGI